MHVCIVGENHAKARMAGVEYQVQLLADEFCRRPGVTITYVARRIPTGVDAEGIPYRLIQIGSDAGIRRRAVFFDATELHRVLAELRPDVIYQQGRLSYTGVCASYARRAGIPFFFHVAHEFDLNFRWVTLKLSPNTPFDFVEYLIGDWGLKHSSHIIVQSDRQGRLLRESLGITAAAVIRNFQPLPDSLPGKPAGPLQIFWVANLKDFKRPALFVELAESFVGRSDLSFIMAGRPPAGRRFGPMMAKIPKVPNLKYLGELPIDHVNRLMDQSAMHVNTSSFEGFPNTFLQAWARGAVVVSLAVDPDEEGMEALGIGYCAGTLERMHSIIDELSRAREKRLAIGEQAFRFVHDKHGLAECARLVDLILQAGNETLASKAAVKVTADTA
jgi:glycosyltransferase involved in cell wall biosynthesis